MDALVSRRRLTVSSVAVALCTATLFMAALAIRSRLLVGLMVLAVIFVPMERIFALRVQRILRPRWKSDLVHLVVNNLLTTALLAIVVVTAGLGLRAAVPDEVRRAVLHQGAVVQFVEAFLLAEVCGYWAHRASHRVPVLWRFHVLHHSIEDMDWLAAGRVHPIDQAFNRSCAVVPLVALGFSRGTFGAFVGFATLQALFIHANVKFRFGPLRWLIATPEFHHWHHGADPAAYDSNFAGEFPWIDLVFGTMHLPARQMPAAYGIAESSPDGYLAQLAWPLRSQRTMRAAELRDQSNDWSSSSKSS